MKQVSHAVEWFVSTGINSSSRKLLRGTYEGSDDQSSYFRRSSVTAPLLGEPDTLADTLLLLKTGTRGGPF